MSNMNMKRIILFYSPQGGAGKSTLAVNTAIFSALSGQRTLLLDMSIYGTVTSSLRIPVKGGYGLSPIITLLDLDADSCNSAKFIEVVKGSILTTSIDENLDVLCSANPVKMEAVNEQYTRSILMVLKQLNYSTIIIDTSAELSERNVVLLEEAESVIIPVVQDVSCGWKVVLFKEAMERYDLPKEKFGLIINQCHKYAGFDNAEFEKEIGYPILGEIPFYYKNYQNQINDGCLIHTIRHRSAYKAFLGSAKMILHLEGRTTAVVQSEKKATKALPLARFKGWITNKSRKRNVAK